MNLIELTREYISSKLMLEFSQGDSSVLKSILFDSKNEFKNWYGKDKYMRSALYLYPNIDKKALSKEYYSNRRLIESAYSFCRMYNEKCRFIKYIYRESYSDETTDIIGVDFKILDGIILPIHHEFWNTYLPPNFPSDYSFFIGLDESESNIQIPNNLPIVENSFKFDFKKIFFSNNEIYFIVKLE